MVSIKKLEKKDRQGHLRCLPEMLHPSFFPLENPLWTSKSELIMEYVGLAGKIANRLKTKRCTLCHCSTQHNPLSSTTRGANFIMTCPKQ
jgi:hypothetical protein